MFEENFEKLYENEEITYMLKTFVRWGNESIQTHVLNKL